MYKKILIVYLIIVLLIPAAGKTQVLTLDRAGLSAATPARAAYSLRKLSSAYSGYAISIRRSSDNALQNIGFNSHGDLDTTAIKTFVGSGSGYITIWYDQSGQANDAIQSITTLQPSIINNGLIEKVNGLPAIKFRFTLADPNIYFFDLPSIRKLALNNSKFEYSTVVSPLVTGAAMILGSYSPTNSSAAGVNKYELYSGGLTSTQITFIPDGSQASGSSVSSGVSYNGSFSVIAGGRVTDSLGGGYKSVARKNGTSNNNTAKVFSLSSTTPDNTDIIQIGTRNNGGTFSFAGRMHEVLIFNTDLGSAERVNLETNQIITYIYPNLANVHIQSNNANPNKAVTGDMVTLSFTSSQTISTPIVTLAGSAATAVNTSGNNWTASIPIAGNTTEGPVTFSIAYKDLSNNSGATVKTSSDGSLVVVDRGAPQLSNISIVSSNADQVRANYGDTITVMFTANEAIQVPVVTISGSAASVVNTSDNNWKASIPVNDNTTEGPVLFSIDYKDWSDNRGVSITSSSNGSSVIVDKAIPQLSNISIVSNNANQTLARYGDTIGVVFTSSEPIQVPVVTIAGSAASVVNTSGNNWKASILVDNSTTEGPVVFSIDYKDWLDNRGVSVTSSSNGSSVIVDKAIPQLSNISIVSNNAGQTRAKYGDTIRVVFTASEPIQVPVVTIAGSAALVVNTSGNNWNASIPVTNTTAEGLVAFSIDYKDWMDNSGVSIMSSSNGSSVIVDKGIPQLSNISIVSNNADQTQARQGDTITVVFTLNEAIQLPVVTIAGTAASVVNTSGNNWKANIPVTNSTADGPVTFSIDYKDLAGNSGVTVNATSNGSLVRVDKIPFLSMVSIVSNNVHQTRAKSGDTVTVVFTASESIQEPTVLIGGVMAKVVNMGGNNWKGSIAVSERTQEGAISYSISFSDLLGNAGSVVTTSSDNSSVLVDRSASQLSNVSIVSDNADQTRAKSGNLITVGFTAGEEINTPVVTIAGVTAPTVNTSGNNWMASIMLSDSTQEGTISFSIDYNDLAGNKGLTVNATSNGNSVIVYRELPVLKNISNEPVAAFGLRKLKTAYTGPAIQIRRSTDNALQNIGFNSNGDLDTAAIKAFIGSVSGYITIWYDQSGQSNDAIQPIAALQPSIINNGVIERVNGLPAIKFRSSSTDTNNYFFNLPGIRKLTLNNSKFEYNTVVSPQGTSPLFILGSYSPTNSSAAGVNKYELYSGGLSSTQITFIPDGSSASSATISGGANYNGNFSVIAGGRITDSLGGGYKSVARKNGTGNANTAKVISLSSITPATTDILQIGTSNNGSFSFAGRMHEVLIFNTDLGSVERVDLEANQTVTYLSPYLTNIHIQSNNANPNKAVTGNIITLSFTASQTITTPNVTLAGSTATVVNTSGNNWTASIPVADNTKEGLVTFSIAYKNASNYSGTIVKSSSDGSLVIVDRGAPQLTNISIISNNANQTLAKYGDTITVVFTASEAIQVPVVTIAESAASVVNTSDNNWKASIPVNDSISEGPVVFSIAYKDWLGNTGINITSSSNGSSVMVDRTVPQLSNVRISSNNADPKRAKSGNTITVSFTASESTQTPTVTIAGSAALVTNSGNNNWTAVLIVDTNTVESTVSFNIGYNDLTGNAGVSVTGSSDSSSVIVDRTVPQLSNVHISSNNADPKRAKSGNTITVSFTTSESIQTPTVTIAGSAALVTNSGNNNWTAVLTVDTNMVESAVSFNIGYNDLTGNAGISVTTSSDSSSVMIDRTMPQLSNVHISSNNADSKRAKSGNTIAVSFTASELIQTPIVTIAGNPAQVINSGNDNWTAVVTVGANTTEGAVSFNIGYTDVAGNAGESVTASSNGSSVTVDRTVPQLSNVRISSNNPDLTKAKPGNTITISFTASESIQTPTVTIAGSTTAVTNTGNNNWTAVVTVDANTAEGVVSFNIGYTDVAGNAGESVTAGSNGSSVTVDRTAPQLSNVRISSNNPDLTKAKPGNTITISFTASETIQTPTVTIAGSTAVITNTGNNNWIATVTLDPNSTEGAVSFNIGYTDVVGNTGVSVTTSSDGSSVMVDRTVPQLSNVHITSNNADPKRAKSGNTITVSFTASESIQTPKVTIAGSAALVTNSGNNNWTAVVTVDTNTAESAVSFTIGYNDLTGNAGVSATASSDGSSVMVDRTVPRLSNVHISSNNADPKWAKGGNTITVSFTASESIQTPTVTIGGSVAVITNKGNNIWTANTVVTDSTSEGNVEVGFYYKDLSGNEVNQVVKQVNTPIILVDRTQPVFKSISISSNNIVKSIAHPGNSIKLVFTGSEELQVPKVTIANIDITPVNINGNTWEAEIKVDGLFQSGVADFAIKIVDLAGNEAPIWSAVTDSSFVRINTDPVKISSFAPTEAVAGAIVSIRGKGFTAADHVWLGGVETSYIVVSDSLIEAKVGAGGASGMLSVATPFSRDSVPGFEFLVQPQLISISPAKGGESSTVLIYGKSLRKTKSILFGGISAQSFTILSDTLVSAIVGKGASGYIVVNTSGGTDSISGFTYVPPVSIQSFYPDTLGIGGMITIRGKNFTEVKGVELGGSVAASFKVMSDTLLTAIVGKQGNGYVSVRTAYYADSLAGFTTADPSIILSTDSLSFGSVVRKPSRAQEFDVKAKYLENDLVITVADNFQIANGADTNFVSSISIPSVNGEVSKRTFKVRFLGDSSGIYKGGISFSSNAAIIGYMALSGTTNCDSLVSFVPHINSIAGDSVFCFRDSLKLTTEGINYPFYKWSTGDTTGVVWIKNTSTISLQVGSSLKCLSEPSVPVRFIKNENPVPKISLVGYNQLSSSVAPNYRWYLNNRLIPLQTGSALTGNYVGLYKVETSLDKICWDESNVIPVVISSASAPNDSLKVVAYPNPATGGQFYVVAILKRPSNVIARLTISDASGVVVQQSNKLLYSGSEIKIPVQLSGKGTYFVRLEVNAMVQTITMILQ